MAEKKASPPPTVKPKAIPPTPENKGVVRRTIKWIRGDAKPNKTG